MPQPTPKELYHLAVRQAIEKILLNNPDTQDLTVAALNRIAKSAATTAVNLLENYYAPKN